jgi:hypothetical protein
MAALRFTKRAGGLVPVGGPAIALVTAMPPTRLHAIVATIEGELAQLTAAVAATELPAAMVAELRVSWAFLVQMLPLAEPFFHGCPICRRILPRAATFCGFCFSRLTPAATYDA